MPARPKTIAQQVTELWELVVAYFKQETVAPLRSLLRYVALGIGGSVLIGFGVVFVSVGLLRVLQVTTSAFEHDWTWVPYLIVVVLLGIGAAITWKARGVAKTRRA